MGTDYDGYADEYDMLVDCNPLRMRDLLHERDAEIRDLKRFIKHEHAWAAKKEQEQYGFECPCTCSICVTPLEADVG
jgi:hypothetical protein